MIIDVLTLFPDVFAALNSGVIAKAMDKSLITVRAHNIRDYSTDKHKKCDDYPFGGGAGMVMTPQPIFDAVDAIDPNHDTVRIYMSPKGTLLNQKTVKNMAKNQRYLILCGSYEGIDQRVLDALIDVEISVGDYVLTGGELPAMVFINAVARYVEGVLGSEESTAEESFSDGLLEYPQYTRPQEYRGMAVPEVLLSGNHRNVDDWRREKQLEITRRLRPDLLEE